jgi:hypothetical protein
MLRLPHVSFTGTRQYMLSASSSQIMRLPASAFLESRFLEWPLGLHSIFAYCDLYQLNLVIPHALRAVKASGRAVRHFTFGIGIMY